jgi:hypothetical protein
MAAIVRTVIIDSDPESRALLRKTLATTPSVAVVSEYADIRLAAVELPARRPDLVIVEISRRREGWRRPRRPDHP